MYIRVCHFVFAERVSTNGGADGLYVVADNSLNVKGNNSHMYPLLLFLFDGIGNLWTGSVKRVGRK